MPRLTLLGITRGIKLPKPLLLNRPSGLYVRFFVPSDLQAQVGSRYVTRSLQGARADGARSTGHRWQGGSATACKILNGVGRGFDSYRGNRTSPTTNPSTAISHFPDACEVGSSRFIPAWRCLAMMKLSSEVSNFCRRIYKKSRRLIDLSGRWKSGFRHPATSTKKQNARR